LISNLERYRKDLDKLIVTGENLELVFERECFKEEFDKQLAKLKDPENKKFIESLPTFGVGFQPWYSEAKTLIKQLLPDRLEDFVRYYEKPKNRKQITFENYSIEDALHGLAVTRGWEKEKVVGKDAALPRLRQQLAILKGVKQRFESSLFDIRQLVQGDLFDSELEAARELAKQKFGRAAGALTGVILERHLSEVCNNHQIKVSKKNPGISDFNDALKSANAVDTPEWRHIQHLGDLRNLCDHSKNREPTADEIDDLISGTAKLVKTLF
jgi:hypothetical protein